jgi:hypothetical protein
MKGEKFMKWENCKRCGSNRVIQKRSIKLPIILVVLGIILRGSGSIAGSGISLGFGLSLIIIGIVIYLFSGRLFCKDCEISWRSSK